MGHIDALPISMMHDPPRPYFTLKTELASLGLGLYASRVRIGHVLRKKNVGDRLNNSQGLSSENNSEGYSLTVSSI